MIQWILRSVYLSFFFYSVRGSGVKTPQHAICSAFSISADKYVDTGLSLSKVAAGKYACKFLEMLRNFHGDITFVCSWKNSV